MSDFSADWEPFDFTIDDVGRCLASRVANMGEAREFYDPKIVKQPDCGLLVTWADEISDDLIAALRIKGEKTAAVFCGWTIESIVFIAMDEDEAEVFVVVVPKRLAPQMCETCRGIGRTQRTEFAVNSAGAKGLN